MRQTVKRVIGVFLGVAVCMLYMTSPLFADASKSTNYQVDETSIGAGGLVQSSSNNFQTSSSISDLAVGNSASANYRINAGSQTTKDPALGFSIGSSTADFGSFSGTSAATTTATFSVLDYTSYGYVVQIVGGSPTNGSHTIPALATNSSSSPGTEQFGINLVANTSPITFGANPDNGQFGYGAAAQNYNTPNQFRYVNGETIASAQKSSGLTNYTISYLVNVAGITPGGQYTSNQTIVVTGTY